jgi:hypothetical protein
MSSIMIRNLTHSTALDRKAMLAVRGGAALGSPEIQIFVPISVSQQNNLVQNTSVLNNSVVGAGAVIPGLSVSPTQWAMNGLTLPSFQHQLA